MDGCVPVKKAGRDKRLSAGLELDPISCGRENVCSHLPGPGKAPLLHHLKLEPVKGEVFRSRYEDVLPGYYSDKINWNSIRPDGEVPDDLMKDMLDESYRLVLEGFSRKRQREILGITCCGADCQACSCYGSICRGCNELSGQSIPRSGRKRPAPIYRCAVYKKHRTSCAGCEELPCEIWRTTKDPELDEAEFETDIRQRMENLKGAYEDGIRLLRKNAKNLPFRQPVRKAEENRN